MDPQAPMTCVIVTPVKISKTNLVLAAGGVSASSTGKTEEFRYIQFHDTRAIAFRAALFVTIMCC